MIKAFVWRVVICHLSSSWRGITRRVKNVKNLLPTNDSLKKLKGFNYKFITNIKKTFWWNEMNFKKLLKNETTCTE
jgi:hypothetical protein